jgi:hypothetical protein
MPTTGAAAGVGSALLATQTSATPIIAIALGATAVLVILTAVIACVATFSEIHSERALKVLTLLVGRPEFEPPDGGEAQLEP